jgi:hypothetical protein
MKQTIIISMIFLIAVAKGFSADFTIKDNKSDSPPNNHITSDGVQNAEFQIQEDYTYNKVQPIGNSNIDRPNILENNLELEETDLSNNEVSEQARSDMIAGAMGIGIF